MKAGVVACCSIALAILGWIMDRAAIGVQLFTYGWSYGFWANALPIVVLFLLLLVLFNRVLLAVAVTLLLMFALYFANYLKLKYLAVPVSFGDVYLLGNLHPSTFRLLAHYVKPGSLILTVLVMVAVLGILAWKGRPFFRRGSTARICLGGVVLFFVLSLGAGSQWLGYVYDAGKLRVIPYAPTMTILHDGLFGSLVYSDVERVRAVAEPVDRSAIQALLALPPVPEATAASNAQRPDIVIVQSESFFDPAILQNIDDSTTLLPNIHRALAQGVGGTMDPPTFGGGTLRTEFEVLTGVPLAAYPQVEFPYLQISRSNIPSVIQVADSAGYSTVAIHGNSGSFWNRSKAFKEIGFGQFVTKKDFPPDAGLDGRYLSDAAMTDQIIEKLNHARSPMLIFAISIEAHGPYLDDPAADPSRRDAIPAPPGLQGNGLQEYRNYVYHILNADRQLGRLWNFLAARGHPYVLMFYGDHLPDLPGTYKQASFDNNLTGPQQFVPWVIVGSNVHHRTEHVYSWMMASEILEAAGVPRPPYYRLVATAEAGLHDGGRRQTIMQGVYSAARLYMDGRLAEFMNSASGNGGGDVASAGYH
jgi:phosphoglycerol transferase MdoB-like AlkP superfamily enzyme